VCCKLSCVNLMNKIHVACSVMRCAIVFVRACASKREYCKCSCGVNCMLAMLLHVLYYCDGIRLQM
jgi:hypothetical protein